jgi:hypothetical protein
MDETELHREAMNRNWLLCVDLSLSSLEAFRITCDKMINTPHDHLYLISLFEKPSKIFHGEDTYNSLMFQHEDLCKKALSFYGHKAESFGTIFTMLGAGCSHIGKKICEAAKQFNIGTIVMGHGSKKGLGSVCSYVIENCETSVLITKGFSDAHMSQKKLSQLIQNEKLVDIGCVSGKFDSLTPTTNPEIMEFFFYDVDIIANEFKAEKDLSKLFENESCETSSESKTKKEGKTLWPKKSLIGGKKSGPFSQLDQMLIRQNDIQLRVADNENSEDKPLSKTVMTRVESSNTSKKKVFFL